MHISITGDLGSGKSTVAKEICNILGYQFLSTGLIQRKLALEKGMDTLEFNKYTDNNKEVDDYIDNHLIEISNGNIPYVLDSRLAWFFVKNSFKVYLLSYDEIAANRILNDDKRIGEPNADDVKKKIAHSNERRKIENARFKRTYGVVFDIYKNFDLVVDTSDASVEDVIQTIVSSYYAWKTDSYYNQYWFSKYRIYPTANIAEVEDIAVSNRINVVRDENHFYLHHDHAVYLQHLESKSSLIPIQIIQDEDSTLLNELKQRYFPQWTHEWEKKFMFKYFEYP